MKKVLFWVVVFIAFSLFTTAVNAAGGVPSTKMTDKVCEYRRHAAKSMLVKFLVTGQNSANFGPSYLVNYNNYLKEKSFSAEEFETRIQQADIAYFYLKRLHSGIKDLTPDNVDYFTTKSCGLIENEIRVQ